MQTIIAATKNQGKIRELITIMHGLGWDVVSRDEAGVPPVEIQENGTTFAENSFIKAKAIMELSGKPVIADDSGLCCDYLDGAPGVFSARFASMGSEGQEAEGNSSEEANNRKLIELSRGVPYEDRTAHYVCVVTLLYPDGRKLVGEGRVDGHIILEPRGQGGFGYDPYFVPEGYEKTFAEMDPKEKNAISHRALAIEDLKEKVLREREINKVLSGDGESSLDQLREKIDESASRAGKQSLGKRIIRMIIDGIKLFRDPYYQGFAAQVAFFYMLSLVPTVLLISQLFGRIFQSSLEETLGWVIEGLNTLFGMDLSSLLSYQSSGVANVFFIIIALWAASRGQFSLTRIINYTMTGGKSTGRGFWIERFRSLGTILLMLFDILIAVGVMVYGGALLEFFFYSAFKNANIWLVLRWPLGFVLFLLSMSFIYYILPTDRPVFKDVVPGGIFASVGILIVTWFYSLYLNYVANFNLIYGALANIVAMMFWFYFVAWVMALGALFNKLLIDTREVPEDPYA